jgi:serine/threonine-protein kinase
MNEPPNDRERGSTPADPGASIGPGIEPTGAAPSPNSSATSPPNSSDAQSDSSPHRTHGPRAAIDAKPVSHVPSQADPLAKTEVFNETDPAAGTLADPELAKAANPGLVAPGTTILDPGATGDFAAIRGRMPATVEFGHSIADSALDDPRGDSPLIAGYKILGELGRGGMGVVYKARQRGLNRLVALKMVLAGAHASAPQLARFHIEAEAVARLQHPNIVQIYEVGEHDGLPFFSLEFVDGGPLDRKLGGKPLPPREAAQLCASLARAMHFAHEHGILHRDLKPANVLLTSNGIPKITDFGLAKRLEENDSSQTKSGTILGTPSYMAPEQALGNIHELGPQSDLYSLGAMLYEFITGKPPFQGPTPMDTVIKVTREEVVAPSRLQSDVPSDLETICVKCLQKEPGNRYTNCFELADDLNRFLIGEPILARPVGSVERAIRWCKRNPKWAGMWGSIAALLLILAGGLTYAAFTINAAKHQAQENERIAQKNEVRAKKNEDKAKEFGNAASQAYATLIGEVQDKLKDKPALQDLKKQILLPAIRGLDSLIIRMDDNKDASNLRNLADAHLQMGRLYREIGQIDQAYKQIEETHRIRENIAQSNPNEEDARAQLATSWQALGDMALHAKGDAARAREDYKRGLTIANDLADHPKSDQPPLMDRKQVVADLYYSLGDIADGPAEAREYYTQSLTRREEWRKANPELVLPIRKVADCYHDLAKASFHSRDLRAASGYFAECLKLREEALSRQPQSVFAKMVLAFEHERLGDFQVRTGHADEGKTSLLNAQARYEELLSTDPKNEEIKKHLSRARYLLGTAYLRLQNKQLAAETYADALKLRQALAEKDPVNLPKQKDYMVNLARCGEHEAAAKKAEEIYKKSPKDVDTLLNLMRCYALCSMTLGGPEDETTPAAGKVKLRNAYAASAANYFEQAVANGSKNVVDIETDPDIDAIQTYAPFKQALSKLRESVQPAAAASVRAPL